MASFTGRPNKINNHKLVLRKSSLDNKKSIAEKSTPKIIYNYPSLMKIKILNTPIKWLPETCVINYPPHNKNCYNIEPDFLKYLKTRVDLLTNSYEEADFYYLPVNWVRMYWNYKFNPPMQELYTFIDSLPIDKKRTFIVSDIDIGIKKLFKTGTYFEEFIMFNSTIEEDNLIGLPELCPEHKVTPNFSKKKYFASFVGSSTTHPIRQIMINKLKNFKDILVYDTSTYHNNAPNFIRTILDSYLSLCPRGTGINSFRFWESMQLGVVPIYVGNKDCRPFGDVIKWDEISFKATTIEELVILLDHIRKNISTSVLLEMGKKAKNIFDNTLSFQKWENYVIRILDNMFKMNKG